MVEKSIIDQQLADLGATKARWGTKRELKYLPGIIVPNEKILGLYSGMVDNDASIWLCVVTNLRILMLDTFLMSLRRLEVHFSEVHAVYHKKGLIYDELMLETSGEIKRIMQLDKSDAKKMLALLQKSIETPPAVADGADVITRLERLGALRKNGTITEEEFETLKAKLIKES